MKKTWMAVSYSSGIAVALLGLGIYVYSLYLAYLTSFVLLLLTLVIPILMQLLWIFWVWQITGDLLNPYTVACLVWVTLLAISVISAVKADA